MDVSYPRIIPIKGLKDQLVQLIHFTNYLTGEMCGSHRELMVESELYPSRIQVTECLYFKETICTFQMGAH